MRRRRDAAVAAASALCAVAVPFAMFVLFARALPLDTVGRFALATALVEFVRVAGLPGLFEALVARRPPTAGNPDDARVEGAALGVLLLLGLLLAPAHAALVFAALALGGAGGGAPSGLEGWLLLAVSLRLPLELAVLQPQAALARRGAVRRLALRTVLGNLGSAAVGVALLAAGEPLWALAGYTVALPLVVLLATALGSGALRRPRWEPGLLLPLRREALAATAARGTGVALAQLDQLVVGVLLGPAVFALYNFGKRVELAVQGLAASLSQSLFQPLFARAGTPREAAEATRRALALATALCGGAAAAFAGAAGPWIRLLVGPAWEAAAPVAAVLAAAGAGRALAAVPTARLSVSGGNAALARVFAASGVAGLALALLAAPWGAAAVAAAALLRVAGTAALLVRAAARGAGGGDARPWALQAAAAAAPFAGTLLLAVGGGWLGAALAPGPWGDAAAAAGSAAGAGAASLALLAVGWRR